VLLTTISEDGIGYIPLSHVAVCECPVISMKFVESRKCAWLGVLHVVFYLRDSRTKLSYRSEICKYTKTLEWNACVIIKTCTLYSKFLNSIRKFWGGYAQIGLSYFNVGILCISNPLCRDAFLYSLSSHAAMQLPIHSSTSPSFHPSIHPECDCSDQFTAPTFIICHPSHATVPLLSSITRPSQSTSSCHFDPMQGRLS